MRDKLEINLLKWYSTLLLIRQDVVKAELPKTLEYLDKEISKIQKKLGLHYMED